MYNTVKRFYNAGFYTPDMVRKFVRCRWITPEQFEEICGEPYLKVDEA